MKVALPARVAAAPCTRRDAYQAGRRTASARDDVYSGAARGMLVARTVPRASQNRQRVSVRRRAVD